MRLYQDKHIQIYLLWNGAAYVAVLKSAQVLLLCLILQRVINVDLCDERERERERERDWQGQTTAGRKTIQFTSHEFCTETNVSVTVN